MIISASRRTDIPAFYSDWFVQRIKDEYVYVRNPMNFHQISKISLSPSIVDCIVFWTKNPSCFIDKLRNFKKYNYYFQFTLTPYGKTFEPNLPDRDELIKSFRKLSRYVGRQRVVWRYDPILLTNNISIYDHMKWFDSLSKELTSYTSKCVISFLDLYKKTEKNLLGIKLVDLTSDKIIELTNNIVTIAQARNIEVVSCAEEIDLEKIGIKHGKCIDDKLISEITGLPVNVGKDSTQRAACGCVASIDVGAYNTCPHGCLYCYANFDSNFVKRNYSVHNVNSPLIVGEIEEKDHIHERKVESCLNIQKRFLFKK